MNIVTGGLENSKLSNFLMNGTRMVPNVVVERLILLFSYSRGPGFKSPPGDRLA
jgi:hypothetical protein